MSSYHGWSDRLQSAGVDVPELEAYETERRIDAKFAKE